LGGQDAVFRGEGFCFIIYSKHNFLGTTQFGGAKEIFGEHCTRIPPLVRACSGVTDGGKGANFLPGKLNVKTGPRLAYISVLLLFSFSLGCC